MALALGVGALAVVAWLATSLPARGALALVSPAERSAVVERAVGNLRDVCRGTGRPRDFCVEQARLVLEQPECDAACQSLARDELGADTAVR
jgi:hypothetical protein